MEFTIIFFLVLLLIFFINFHNSVNSSKSKNCIVSTITDNIKNNTVKNLRKEDVLKFLLYYWYVLDEEIKTFKNKYKDIEKYKNEIEFVFYNESINSNNNHVKRIIPLLRKLFEKIENKQLPLMKIINDKNLENLMPNINEEITKKIKENEEYFKNGIKNYKLKLKNNNEVSVNIKIKNNKAKNDNFNDKSFNPVYEYNKGNIYLESGKSHLRKQQFQEALEDINKAIKVNHSLNGDDFYYRALVYMETENIPKAIKDLQRAATFIEDKNDKEKINKLLKKLNVEQENTDYTPKLGEEYFNRRKKILEMNGYDINNVDYFIEKSPNGTRKYNMENLSNLNLYIKEQPKNGNLLVLRSLVYKEMKNYENSKLDLTRALEVETNTKNKKLIVNLIDNLNQNQNLKKIKKSSISKTENDEVIVIDSSIKNKEKSDLYIKNANEYESKKDYINAINEYTKAIELNPDNLADIYLYRAECCLELGQYNNVIEDCTKSIETTTMYNSATYYTRGLAYQNLNNKNEALKDYEKALSINTNNKLYKDAIDLLLKKSNSKVDLQTCTKEELITLNGFTEDKANKFINERNNGQMWYDIDTFIQEFEIQPHEMILIQDRIKFPEKPKNRYGRRIDI